MRLNKTAPEGLDPIETASLDELQALQLQRMRWSLQHAYDHVPHYRAAFDAKGVQPGDLKSLADLALFPFTTKKDLRDNYPFGMFAVPREQVARVHASSGTTGKPTVVGYTAADIDVWSRARCVPLAPAPETSSTSLMAMVCSPVAWARITVPSGSVVR